MSPHVHFDHDSWEFPASLTLTLLLAATLYLRVWISTRSGSAAAIPAWKAGSFLLGLVLVWMAWGSPLAAYDHSLLTVHMIKHLLLMTFAPPLILLGEPMKVFWGMTPLLARSTLRRVWHQPLVQRLARIVTSRWTSGWCRSEEHTSELQSHLNLVCRLLLEKKKLGELIAEGLAVKFTGVIHGAGLAGRFRVVSGGPSNKVACCLRGAACVAGYAACLSLVVR